MHGKSQAVRITEVAGCSKSVAVDRQQSLVDP
jgi:hypothetical protein